eukprot:3697699-Pyramimonas_sp.AAC.1
MSLSSSAVPRTPISSNTWTAVVWKVFRQVFPTHTNVVCNSGSPNNRPLPSLVRATYRRDSGAVV